MLAFCKLAMYVMYMVQRNEKELLTRGCRRTGVNLNVTKSHMGQYTRPLINVGIKSLFSRATISVAVSPCSPAFMEKKIAVMIGPYTACPRNIFLKVVSISLFGRNLDTVLNHKCKEGPETNIPYPAIRKVLIRSIGSTGLSVII